MGSFSALSIATLAIMVTTAYSLPMSKKSSQQQQSDAVLQQIVQNIQGGIQNPNAAVSHLSREETQRLHAKALAKLEELITLQDSLAKAGPSQPINQKSTKSSNTKSNSAGYTGPKVSEKETLQLHAAAIAAQNKMIAEQAAFIRANGNPHHQVQLQQQQQQQQQSSGGNKKSGSSGNKQPAPGPAEVVDVNALEAEQQWQRDVQLQLRELQEQQAEIDKQNKLAENQGDLAAAEGLAEARKANAEAAALENNLDLSGAYVPQPTGGGNVY